MHAASTTIRLGPFDLHAPIGQGGMGEVWQASHRVGGTDVAVKVMTVRQSREPHFREAFSFEVRSVARLSHPAIVRVFDHGIIPGQTALASQGLLTPESPYLVMELAMGTLENLDPLQLDWEQQRTILLGLLDALAHAHARGVIHRDIKPANVLIVPDESGPRLKLSDFGLARPRENDPDLEGATPERVTGTPRYMAPEQILGRWRDQGPWTDLYALGCVAYWLAGGAPPFGGEDTEQILRKHLKGELPPVHARLSAPAGYQDWLSRLLAKEPRDRYRYAADAAYDLERLKQGEVEVQPLEILGRVGAASKENAEAARTDLMSDTVVISRGTPENGRQSIDLVPAMAGSTPPMPPDWRGKEVVEESHLLSGVGLGLYGLRPVPMVGRRGECDRLWAALGFVTQTRRPRITILQGAAGTGKSRIAQWMAERAHEVGAASVMKATHHHAPMASNGLARMFANHLRLVGLNREEIFERLQPLYEVAGAVGSDELHDLVVLSELFAACSDPSYVEELARVQVSAPAERYGPMERLLARLAMERPIIVWIDDVQWGSDALSFALHLMTRRRTGSLPVLMILTVRDEALVESPIEAGQLHGLVNIDGVEQLEIVPLDEAEHFELVEHLLGLDDGLTREVARRTAGNPLFAILLVGDWVEREILEPTSEGYRLRQGADATLPDDIHHLLLRRIELLAGQSVGVDVPLQPKLLSLELAAALGTEIDQKEWKALCRQRGIEAPGDVVEDMVSNRLARLTPRGWNFFHGALREGLERLARESKRWEDHHRSCAYVLQELYPANRPGVSRRLSWHWLQARDFEAALSPLLQAATEFRQNYRFPHARALLEQREEAIRRLCLPEEDVRWAEGWVALAVILADLGDREGALALLENATRRAQEQGWTKILADCAFARAVITKTDGLFDECLRWIAEAIEHYEVVSYRLGIAKCHQIRGSLGLWTGANAASQEDFEKARVIFEELRESRGIALCAHWMAANANRMGDYDRAEELTKEAIEGFEAMGDRTGAVNCLNTLGEIYRHRGDLERAEGYYEMVVKASEHRETEHPAYFNLGMVRMIGGDYSGARAILERMLERLLETPREGMLAVAHAYLVPCCAADGDWEAFDHHLSRAEKYIAAQSIAHEDIAFVMEMAAQLAMNASEVARGNRATSLTIEQWRSLGDEARVEELENFVTTVQFGKVE